MRFNLKTARRLKGYTPQDMAETLGISASFYYKIEKGSTNPSFKLALKIADLLDYKDVRELFEMEEPS